MVLLVVVPVAVVLAYRFLPPPITPLMAIRLAEGQGLDRRWQDLSAVSPLVATAVVAAEDNLFCRHRGFDWQAIRLALADYRAGRGLRGASTISMQTAKNILLWPDRSLLRKALEAYVTVLVEAFWDKRRILEIYLNVAEWAPGVYGVEAAARHYFGKAAAELSSREAALLAVLLPDPTAWPGAAPPMRLQRRADIVMARAATIRPLLDCL